MRVVTAEQMRALDQRTIDEAGIAGIDLMRTAGIGLADSIGRLARRHGLDRPHTLFVAGHGNNGGDAFVAATELVWRGWPVECWLAAAPERVRGDARFHFDEMQAAQVPLRVIDDGEDWHVRPSIGRPEIVVDGLLGTGVTGAPRGNVASAIEFINSQRRRALIVAIDTPSAMAVDSDLTVAMGLPKVSCVMADNVDWVGNLDVVDIGIPLDFVADVGVPTGLEFIDASDVAAVLPVRGARAHKGTFGHALCIGGSLGFSGAITMAARSAARSGAGLVSTVVPKEIYAVVASAIPEAMTHVDKPDGRYTSILVGPGTGRSDATKELASAELQSATVPVVLDADAITVFADDRAALAAATCPLVITPHPGEFATLFGLDIAQVQANRPAMAQMAADELGATVILKGAGTIVAHPGSTAAINLTGNPGMATGGSGDVLAGLVCGLLTQGLAPLDAARAAVWLHGRAGDYAAAATSQASMIAPDLVDYVSEAFRELSPR